jgi:heme A synthase
VEYEPENVFTQKDETVMKQYRQVCRRALAAGIGGAVLSLIIYVLLVRWKEKDLMRRIMGMSGVSLFLFGGLHVLTLVYGPVRRVVYGRWIDFSLPEKDYLVQLVDNSFAVQLAVMTCVAAVIFYLILLYITFRMAGKRNVFKRSVWAEPQK